MIYLNFTIIIQNRQYFYITVHVIKHQNVIQSLEYSATLSDSILSALSLYFLYKCENILSINIRLLTISDGFKTPQDSWIRIFSNILPWTR